MKKLVEFLKENPHISIRKIERDLGLRQSTIRLTEEIIPEKSIDKIREYLVEHYGFGEIVNLDGNMESKSQIIHKYNVGRIPGFTDGLLRFQDEVGLWKRVANFGMVEQLKDYPKKEVKKTKGLSNAYSVPNRKILKEGYKPQSEERFTDKIGEFYIANNGLKIYEKFK